MRKVITLVASASMLGLLALSPANAEAVPGYEEQYDLAFAACTPSGGIAPDPDACALALEAYMAALIAGGIDPTVARTSVAELQVEVATAGGDAAINGIFVALLTETEATDPEDASPV